MSYKGSSIPVCSRISSLYFFSVYLQDLADMEDRTSTSRCSSTTRIKPTKIAGFGTVPLLSSAGVRIFESHEKWSRHDRFKKIASIFQKMFGFLSTVLIKGARYFL